MLSSPRPRRGGETAWSVALLAGVWLFTFFDVVARGRTFVGGDPQIHHFPLLALVRPLWSMQGGLPLWNPLLATGQPWAANPEQAAFHPLTALFLLLPAGIAFRLQVLLPVLAAAAGGLFLGRALGRSRAASLLLATTWGFGGALLSATQYFPNLFAAAALPWVLGFAARIGAGGSRRDLAGLALAEGLLCAAGEPTQVLLSAPLAHLAAGTASRGEPEGTPPPAGPPRARVAALVLAGIALGAVVAAPVLVPGLLHGRKTVRARALPPEVAGLWSASPFRLGELLLPSTLGGPRGGADPVANARRAEWRRSLYPGRNEPYLESIYPGLVTTLLAAFAWRRARGGLAWAGAAALCGLVALGTHAPLWEAVRALPLLSGTRYPEKLLLVVGLALSVSAAFGLDALAVAGEASRRRLALAAAALAGVALAAPVFLSPAATAAFPGRILAAQGVVQGAIAAAAALLVAALGARRPRLLPGALLLLAAADVAVRGRDLLRTGPPEALVTLPPQAGQLLASPPRGYLFHAAAHRAERWDAATLGSPPAMARLGIATALDVDFGMTELAWSAGATKAVLAAMAEDPALSAPLLRRRSIAAILRFRPPVPASPAEAEGIPPERLLELLAVKDPLPWAFCADSVRAARGEEGWRRTVSALGEAAASVACVDPADGAIPASVSRGVAVVRERRPDSARIAVDVEGPAPAYLAVNQTWDPGWRATVDGRETPLLRADLSLSGLVVPAGRHEVLLEYRDAAVTASAGLGLAGLAACAALALPWRRRAGPGAVSSGR